MGFLQWIGFELANWKKLVKLEIDFDLITKNGNVICTKYHNVKKLKTMIINYSDFGYYEYLKQIRKEYKKEMNKLANSILSEYQEKKRIGLNCGVLDCGDYIVKCWWEITPRFESMNYKEYKKWKMENKK